MLLTGQQSQTIESQQATASDTDADRIEVLRQILIVEQNRNVEYEEAQEIGDSLIDFYQTLAEEVGNAPAN